MDTLTVLKFPEADGADRMISRLVHKDNPRVERLIAVGDGVVRQFGLRAIVNLATGSGVTVLLLLLGVDYPLLWGCLPSS